MDINHVMESLFFTNASSRNHHLNGGSSWIKKRVGNSEVVFIIEFMVTEKQPRC